MNTYDECYFINYDSCSDIELYEIGKQACLPDYSYGPVIRNQNIFHYVFSGSGALVLNDKSYSVHAHQGFLIPANALAYYKADHDEPWDYIWIHINGPKVQECLQKAGLNVNSPVFIPTGSINEIEQIMVDLLKNNKRELYCIGKVFELFEELTTLSKNRNYNETDTKLTYIKTIIDYIQIKYSEPIHMSDISTACGLDRSYMTRLFKEATGETPQEYLLHYRMKKACNLLKTCSSIQNIAYAVGYVDSFTFSKAFKRYCQMSPSEYRNKMK